MIESLSH